MKSVYWQILDGEFIFPEHLNNIYSSSGRHINEVVKNTCTELQIFIRGSLLENELPFSGADADLFVLYTNSSQLNELRYLLPPNDFYDIKFLSKENLGKDFVFNALLNCRSLQISGEQLIRKPVKADKQFAWEHWVKYCPAMIPDRIDTQSTMALIHFKLLTRCFGVLSFLKNKSFTRDISECIFIAENEESKASDMLKDMRNCIEYKKPKIFNVANIKNSLTNKFDQYYNCW